MYPENPVGTLVIVGSMNMGYISDTARNRTHNPFRTKCAPIPLGHSDHNCCYLQARKECKIYIYPLSPGLYRLASLGGVLVNLVDGQLFDYEVESTVQHHVDLINDF